MNKLIVSMVVFAVYIFIILAGPRLQLGNQQMSLDQLTSQQIVISLIAAAVFLVAAALLLGWRRSVGLVPPRSAKSLWATWLPMLMIIAFFTAAFAVGVADWRALLFVGINTLFVGIGEELAFRGFVFDGLSSVVSLRWAIFLSCVIFGGVHVSNGFMTGDFLASSIQAVSAGLSGLIFVAILLRTGSLIPGMIVHWLWDFGLFALASHPVSPGVPPEAAASVGLGTRLLGPLLLDLPNVLLALWLLWGISKKTKSELVG